MTDNKGHAPTTAPAVAPANSTADDAHTPLTVGDLRAAIDGLPNDAQVLVEVGRHGPDYAVEWAFQTQLVPWSHECAEDDAGRDCPTAWGVEIHVQEVDKFGGAE